MKTAGLSGFERRTFQAVIYTSHVQFKSIIMLLYIPLYWARVSGWWINVTLLYPRCIWFSINENWGCIRWNNTEKKPTELLDTYILANYCIFKSYIQLLSIFGFHDCSILDWFISFKAQILMGVTLMFTSSN